MPGEPAPLKAKAKKKNAPKSWQEILGDILVSNGSMSLQWFSPYMHCLLMISD
jgi:hypothetical protein